MSRLTRTTAALALVLLLALALRLGAAAWWQSRLPAGTQFGFADSESYWQLGQTIARGQTYQFGSPQRRVFRTPGYPLLLAGLFQLAGPDVPVFWARAESALLSTLAVAGVYWFGQHLFDVTTGLVAALLAALYPGAVMLGALVLSEAPFCALLPLQLVLWQKGWRAESPRAFAAWMYAAGLVAGAATLVRPSWLLFTPLALLLAILFSPERKRHAASAFRLLLGLCLVMTPWWVRNGYVTGHFVPTTLQVGASLYDGLNPHATGASNMDFVPAVENGSEYQIDRRLREEAIDWAWSHPRRVLELAGVKLLRTWNVWPNAAEFRHPALRVLVLVTYTPLLVLSLWGAWRYCRRGWPHVLCVLPAVYITLLHTVFVGSIRYREPAMLALIVLAAAVLVERFRPARSSAQPS